MRIWLTLLFLWLPAAGAAELDAQRAAYKEAQRLLDTRRITEYRKVRAGLAGYSLGIYLDYRRMEGRLRWIDSGEAKRFIAAAKDSPLAGRFKHRYLQAIGRGKRWRDYLVVSPEAPEDPALQCYYYRAVNQAGDKAAAWAGARALWVHGQSRPKACDVLFREWRRAGGMSDAASWERQLLAFGARNRGLMTYAAKYGSAALAPWSERLRRAYRRPDRVERLRLPVADARSRDIYVAAIKRRARRDAADALALWQRAARQYPFTATQQEEARRAIAQRGLWQKDLPVAALDWIDQYIIGGSNAGAGAAGPPDISLLETRLRLAIKQSDWNALLQFIAHLPSARAQADVWRFWQAYARREQGDVHGAEVIWLKLADTRSYYGFLSAVMTGQPFHLNHAPIRGQPPPALLRRIAVRRAGELMHHGEESHARSEWRFALQGADAEERALLARYASRHGWHNLAISAANVEDAWDALDIRFPRPFESIFARYGQRYAVPATELMAIARRESAFYPQAVSSAGARGLMQVLPATARQVSRSPGVASVSGNMRRALFDVNVNVALGGAYYRQLLDRYEDNRVLTLAAYNAGPRRVRRWLSGEEPGLSAPQWIETIPFNETRDYVKAVLAYNVVYQAMAEADSARLFNRPELEFYY